MLDKPQAGIAWRATDVMEETGWDKQYWSGGFADNILDAVGVHVKVEPLVPVEKLAGRTAQDIPEERIEDGLVTITTACDAVLGLLDTPHTMYHPETSLEGIRWQVLQNLGEKERPDIEGLVRIHPPLLPEEARRVRNCFNSLEFRIEEERWERPEGYLVRVLATHVGFSGDSSLNHARSDMNRLIVALRNAPRKRHYSGHLFVRDGQRVSIMNGVAVQDTQETFWSSDLNRRLEAGAYAVLKHYEMLTGLHNPTVIETVVNTVRNENAH